MKQMESQSNALSHIPHRVMGLGLEGPEESFEMCLWIVFEGS